MSCCQQISTGAYNIDRTIILNRFLSTETQLIHMLGHELPTTGAVAPRQLGRLAK